MESVAGWLKLLRLDDVVETFRDNDISGVVLLDLDDELLEEMEIEPAKRKTILTAVEELKKNEGASAEAEINTANSSDEDDDDEPDAKAAAAAKKESSSTSFFKSSKKATVVEKNKDPLRLAARTRAVADLSSCTVMSGYLWKIGGSGLKPKHWQRRFFVLTDDNCLYYFKSPKDLSALGIILLPSYTITVCEKAENPGARPHAFKAYNREQEGARKYILAAEDERDMKTWMNVLSLASIAFGSGKASMARAPTAPPRLADDHDKDLEMMQKRAAERAGGVAGSGEAVVAQQAPRSGFVSHGSTKLNKNHAPCHIKLLDGRIMKLFAEPTTTGQHFIEQICDTLKLYEKYYFGLKYIDSKGDEDWIKPEKKILKHLFPRGDHLDLEFCVQFYPMDVTQVMQYVTLYQCFLAARQSVLTEELDVSNKDAFLLASLYLQAVYGDFDPAVHTPVLLSKEQLVPERNKTDIMKEAQIKPADLELFWVEEVVRTWLSLKGILRHLTVLKYIQVIQKHRRFAMQYFHVKNSQGTPLVLGINPHGLFMFRNEQLHRPVATFSWAECSELSFTEKKFSIQVHDKETKAFSVTCARSKICQRILNLCIGLHRLYVLTIRQWADAPPDMMAQRKQAIEAAIIEREELKKEAAEVRRKAKELKKKEPVQVSAAAAAAAARTQPKGTAPLATTPAAAAAAGARAPPATTQLTAPTGEVVYIKGRDEAVRLMDLMMADEDFMRYQEELFQDVEDNMADQIEKGGRLRSQSFMGKKGMRQQDEQHNVGELDDTPVSQRAERLSQIIGSD